MPEQPQWSERTLDMPPQDPWGEQPTAQAVPPDGLPVNLNTTGGVGLYLTNCGVLVRHCRLTPSELQK